MYSRLWLTRLLLLVLLFLVLQNLVCFECSEIWLLVIYVAFLLAYLPYLIDFHTLDHGEITFLYVGKRMKHGERLYSDLLENKPPMIYLIAYLVNHLAKNPIRLVSVGRIVSLMFNSISFFSLFIMSCKLFSVSQALLIVILYALATTQPSWLSMALIPEVLVSTFSILTFTSLTILPNPYSLVLAGFSYSLALLSKQSALFLLPALLATLFYLYGASISWFIMSMCIFGISGALLALLLLLVLHRKGYIDMTCLLSRKTTVSRVSPLSAMSIWDIIRIGGALALMNPTLSLPIMISILSQSMNTCMDSPIDLIASLWAFGFIFLQFVTSPPFSYTLFPAVPGLCMHVADFLVYTFKNTSISLCLILVLDVAMYAYKYRKELRRSMTHLRDLTALRKVLDNISGRGEMIFVYPGGSEVYLFCDRDTPSKVTSHNYHTLLVNSELYEEELNKLCDVKVFILDNFEFESLENHLKLRKPSYYNLGVNLIERLKGGRLHIKSVGRYDVWLKLDGDMGL